MMKSTGAKKVSWFVIFLLNMYRLNVYRKYEYEAQVVSHMLVSLPTIQMAIPEIFFGCNVSGLLLTRIEEVWAIIGANSYLN